MASQKILIGVAPEAELYRPPAPVVGIQSYGDAGVGDLGR